MGSGRVRWQNQQAGGGTEMEEKRLSGVEIAGIVVAVLAFLRILGILVQRIAWSALFAEF
jgi:hypothetical protein